MKKLRLELDAVRVESFATARGRAVSTRGTMRAFAATDACPTNHCATVPLFCETVFAPQCTGTTCTG
ncbi:hypothetical protein [Longimicrobium sp.]|uniref:hypothetical protein n=1 Tax=Longimicrobium sp. TaxID=2029185 RepID=UPI002C77F990|nr:hypothetical protein [Longimicrobium sp.]HSU12561.1 hypothetical protein [Longimicrobium sp.]